MCTNKIMFLKSFSSTCYLASNLR